MERRSVMPSWRPRLLSPGRLAFALTGEAGWGWNQIRKYIHSMNVELRNIPGRIYLRYLLLTIPGVVVLILVLMIVEHWLTMPSWLFWAVIFLWLAKEVVIFPFVWHAHDPNRPGISRTMIGARGIVKKRIDPVGYILVAGELWKAERVETELSIEKGEHVRVVKMEGLKLFVAFESSEDQS